ncbi:hypothetical protein CsSME_00010362 [Camellia sinensis var. sinensis]
MSKYREAFAKRMATAGLKSHHRIDLLSLFVFIFMGELDSGLLNFTNHWADLLCCVGRAWGMPLVNL